MALEDIPETGMHLEIDAPEPARSEIVPLAGVRELPRLSAVFDLSRRGAGVRVTGQVSARVGQTCVVTLEPIENDLEEQVDLMFSLASTGHRKLTPKTMTSRRSRLWTASSTLEPLPRNFCFSVSIPIHARRESNSPRSSTTMAARNLLLPWKRLKSASAAASGSKRAWG